MGLRVDNHTFNASFPPLSSASPSTSILGQPNLSSSRSNIWKDLLLAQNDKCQQIPLSYIPSDSQVVSFSAEEIAEGKKEWNLSLIGHAIGKRPYYGSLLAAIKKKWKFKGSLELLTLEVELANNCYWVSLLGIPSTCYC